jgi:hypothetical protein
MVQWLAVGQRRHLLHETLLRPNIRRWSLKHRPKKQLSQTPSREMVRYLDGHPCGGKPSVLQRIMLIVLMTCPFYIKYATSSTAVVVYTLLQAKSFLPLSSYFSTLMLLPDEHADLVWKQGHCSDIDP